ncbi:hypothetical protein K1W54_04430 [Micromonospora sp. CPCC 205371]|nr:hypothetical protein [Micromonospora sp. CPCC 205371]
MTTNLPVVRPSASLVLPRPARSWLGWGSGTVSVAAGAAGAVLMASNPTGDGGAWLLIAAGVSGVLALSQAADQHRSTRRVS